MKIDSRKCVVCEEVFIPKTKRSIWCSKKCKHRYEAIKYGKNKKPKTKHCQQCNSEFTPYTSLNKFCSANCRVERDKSKRKWKWSIESVNKRYKSGNPCYRTGMYSKSAKKDNSGQSEFNKKKNEYKIEFENKNGSLFCERCGCSGVKLESHHIIYRSEKPRHIHLHDKENILLLCVKCHNWYHKNKSNRNDIVLNRELHLIFGQDVLDK